MRVDIILPAFNCASFLEDAVKSTLNDPIRDVRVILVDDCSTDKTLSVAKKLALEDKRITLIENNKNKGLIQTLNDCLELVTAPYILRMDGDDISEPGRISKQLEAVHRDKSVLCGSSMRFFGAKNGYWLTPASKNYCDLLMFRPPFGHSTALIDSEWLKSNNLSYDKQQDHAEDYGLWAAIENKGGKVSLLRDSLVKYRIHTGSVSRRNVAAQMLTSLQISATVWKQKGYSIPHDITKELSSIIQNSENGPDNTERTLHIFKQLALYFNLSRQSIWFRSEFVRFFLSFYIHSSKITEPSKLAPVIFSLDAVGSTHFVWRRKILRDAF